ncbi:DUF503 domain-containing protein [Peptoniphilus sp.]|jgi:uncharacterized protein YlxP (DUF503 family)|uniref:DUF503 domain-containing protein n=1 Tax=Peptoniphilus sp. TaxID=1971214 RepID=UPI003D91D99C
MLIGICTCEIFIYEANSLKEKRRIVKSIIEKSKNRFNISISEVGYNDKWQKALIGFAIVSNDKVIVEQTIESVTKFMSSYSEIEIIDIDREIL